MKLAVLALFALTVAVEGRSFSFCQLFISGGTCEPQCEYEAVHKWGMDFHLCPTSTGKCCIPLDHPLVKLFLKRQRKTTTTTTSTTTTIPTTTTTQTTTSQTTTTTKLQISEEPLKIQPEKTCGQSRVRSRIRRVVGGNSAPSGAWPWQVAIRTYTGHYVCGGVLLSSGWVMTAAHCFKGSDDNTRFLRVYMGDQRLSYDHESGDKFVKIAKIIQHEDFERNVNVSVDDGHGNTVNILRHVHDIALVKLETSIEFNEDLEPICLPEVTDDLNRDDCWVIGWGETEDTSDKPIKNLQEVQGRSIGSAECSERWGTNFTDDVVCFGSEGRGPCKGDSGSGMSCRHPDGHFHLVGIVSWGREDCVHDDHPSVLTNVAEYREWIDRHLMLSN